jgi:TolB-like protein/class 3 adenylate cyclase
MTHHRCQSSLLDWCPLSGTSLESYRSTPLGYRIPRRNHLRRRSLLTAERHRPEPDRVLITVLFTDIVGSTERAAALGDCRWRELLLQHHSLVRQQLERFGGHEIDTAGDGFLASFDRPERAVRCALAVSHAVRPLGINVRAGLHTGECEVIGEKVGGIGLHIGARVAALAAQNEVLVSGTVKDLVAGSGLRFGEHGVHVLRGIPGEWRLFSAEDASDEDEWVADNFREAQTSCVPDKPASSTFLRRVWRLLSHGPTTILPATSSVPAATAPPLRTSRRFKPTLPAIIAVLVAGVLGYFFIDRFWISRHGAVSQPAMAAGQTALGAGPGPSMAAFAPPLHSIAVLPFVNMSSDKEQEYFSDGLTEELLNTLTRINELRVAARTSAFSFKGKDTDIDTIARKLNVAAVLEGSVRRSMHTVRITAQLVDAVTGFQVWSQTYDRDLGDVLVLQTEIATSVANALKATLLEDTGKKIE